MMKMDVDLLRPGTVPLNPDTVFYFEFLLNPDLLEQHLNKIYPDPSPVDLLTKFINTILESFRNDGKPVNEDKNNDQIEVNQKFKDTKKNLALRILSLKILAFLKWNLDFMIKNIPVKFQAILFQDLLYFTTENEYRFEIPFPKDFQLNNFNVSEQFQFSLILYHRWIVKLFVFRSIQIRYLKGFVFNTSHQYENAYLQFLNDEAVKLTLDVVEESVKFLENILINTNVSKMITYEVLVPLREQTEKIQHDWNKLTDINFFEFKAQLHYDLGTFFFQQKNFDNARSHFRNSLKFFKTISHNLQFQYLSFSENSLNGYLSACDVSVDDFDGHEKSLTHKFLYYIYVELDNDSKIIEILLEDNQIREIPMTYRTNYELDLQAALVYNLIEGKFSLLTYVQILNIIRNVLDQRNVFTADIIDLLKENKQETIKILEIGLAPFIAADELQKMLIRTYLKNVLIELHESKKFSEVRSLDFIKAFIDFDVDFQPKIDTNSIDFNDISWTTFECFQNEPEILQEKILSSLNFDEDVINIRKLLKGSLNDIFVSNDKIFQPIWRIANETQLPLSVKSVISSLPNLNNLKDLANFFLMKSRRFLETRNFHQSKAAMVYLVNLIKKQDNSAPIKKFLQLLEFELLFIEINEMLEFWSMSTSQRDEICKKCKLCLSALKSDDLVPRLEIAESCLIGLLNCGEWDYILTLEKGRSLSGMTTVLSNVCIEFTMFKNNKKAYKEIWDLVLPIFSISTASSSKRFTSGTNPNALPSQRDAPISSKIKKNFIDFIMRIRDVTCFNILLSLLSRIYNVLKDDSNLELSNEYLYIWPVSISNTNSYSIQDVCEVLDIALKQALKYFAKKTQYLKLMADLSFVKGHSRTALRQYVITLIYSTDNFLQPIVKPYIDDYIIRRMIRCCLQLNCFIQVTILCQFLEDVDYALAFKSLNDSKINGFSDAADQLYPFIWNNTILEYIINLHHKHGEGEKKLQALKTIGLLELNANNNEEIRKEAANVRKQNFLRVLVKQYVLCNDDQFFDSGTFRFEPVVEETVDANLKNPSKRPCV